jgi:hypothetical protein
MTGTRLNDCTPTPDEQAKYHEAQIRALRSKSANPRHQRPWGTIVYEWSAEEIDVLLRLLDEARAEATVAMEQLRKTCAEILGADTDWPQHGNVPFAIAVALQLRVTAIREARAEIAHLTKDNESYRATQEQAVHDRDIAWTEIARLRAPPEADVMELAHKIAAEIDVEHDDTMQDKCAVCQRVIPFIARALTAYGDQRAANARREARAAAFEEAAQRLNEESERRIAAQISGAIVVGVCVSLIRALAAAPPQSERPPQTITPWHDSTVPPLAPLPSQE